MKVRYLFLLIFAFLLVAGPGSAQTTVRGQIFLPDGNTPSVPIRFDLEGTNGLHDVRFTDSNGRFILERLQSDTSFTIFVQSDEVTWGDTRIKFIPDENMDQRFYLNPLPAVKLVKPAPYKPSAAVVDLHDRGVKAFTDGNADEAEKLLRQAMAADPKYVTAFNDLGVMLMRERRYPDAEVVLRKGLDVNPKSATLLENLGIDLIHAEKYEDAVVQLTESLRIQPARGDAHLQLGAALVELGRYPEAEQELLAAQRAKGADETGLQLYFGKLYASTGDYPKAIAAFNEYLKLAPTNSPSLPTIRAAIQRMQDEMAKRKKP